MKTPESMNDELGAWNNGTGTDLETWIYGSGNFSLAVGYASVFWPEFVVFEGYLLRAGFSETSLRGFEGRKDRGRESVEWVMNHLHLADIHCCGCNDGSKDKLVLLGNVIKEIHEAKLLWQFPDRPCTVEFYVPDNSNDLMEYQLSFWQKGPESDAKFSERRMEN